MDFGQKLQNLRKNEKLSQEELAEKLNVSRQAVSKWESNQSYPEMEKLIEMAKIFNCTLDELTNREPSINRNRKTKNPINDFIDDVTKLVNKSINMFTVTNGKEIFKILFVLFLVMILLAFLRIPCEKILRLVVDIFNNFGNTISNIFSSILYLIFNVIYIVGGFLVIFYVYKNVFLNKYDETNLNEKTKTKNFEEINSEKKINETIDLKDRTKEWNVLLTIGKITVFFIKIVMLILSIPFFITLVGSSFLIAISVYLFIKGVYLIGIFLIILSIIMIVGSVLDVILNFIFNKKSHVKSIVITLLISFIFLGLGLGITIIQLSDYKVINSIPKGFNKVSYIKEVDIDNNTTYDSRWEKISNYVVDNTKSDVEIKIDYYDGMSKPLIFLVNNQLTIRSADDEIDFQFVKKVIDNLKDKTIYDYSMLNDYEITITASEDNINILKSIN